jgi:hypothetical protein
VGDYARIGANETLALPGIGDCPDTVNAYNIAIGMIKAREPTMLILQIQDLTLEKQLTELLQQKFDGNSEKMLQELLKTYTAQRNRSKYSGILKWEQDGLTFQKEIRREWQ